MKGERSMPEKPHEEYLLYVRVPDPEDQSRGDALAFMERLAVLLSDDEAGIYVEPAATYDGEQKPRGKHGEESGIKYDSEDRFGNSPVSSDKNTLGPMYFCHNKF